MRGWVLFLLIFWLFFCHICYFFVIFFITSRFIWGGGLRQKSSLNIFKLIYNILKFICIYTCDVISQLQEIFWLTLVAYGWFQSTTRLPGESHSDYPSPRGPGVPASLYISWPWNQFLKSIKTVVLWIELKSSAKLGKN